MLLRRYAFPGNIAELRDLVERAAVQAGEAAPQLNADLFWFATQASRAGCLCSVHVDGGGYCKLGSRLVLLVRQVYMPVCLL